MAVGSWCNSGNGNIGYGQAEKCYDLFMSLKISATGSKTPIWRVLWRKIKKEKKKIFDSSTAVQFTYDPNSYSQNFDQGLTWADPDDLSRSFSASPAIMKSDKAPDPSFVGARGIGQVSV
ncbi:hypothetical protein F0562_022966 [Nyssa sinensis]|uniref:Uncharacterized protein n=1 Tax=Nyssa sinensis TaxID=561372 RepID=A0A5J5BGL0_9ASTE|nr:hypothetical protein F0562_022966 [Nyssa sinensis]